MFDLAGFDDTGFDGTGLAGELGWLHQQGFDVPAGWVISAADGAELASTGWSEALRSALDAQLTRVQAATGRTLDDPDRPLLLVVRPSRRSVAATISGTLVDLGVTVATLGGVIQALGDERAALDVRRRFLEGYAALGLGLDRSMFVPSVESAIALVGTPHLPADVLRHVCNRHEELIEQHGGLPSTSRERLEVVIERMARSWVELPVGVRRRSGVDWSLVVQAMAFDRPSSGVVPVSVTSRDTVSGADGAKVTVRHQRRSSADLDAHVVLSPVATERLGALAARAEAELGSVAVIDAAVWGDEVAVVGARPAVLSGPAAFRVAHSEVVAGRITKAEALGRITAEHVEQVLHPTFDVDHSSLPIAQGLAASPGAATGRVAFSADDAETQTALGHRVILVAQETSPEDMHGMQAAVGIVTTRGGLASHAAVVARGWGTPAVCGAEGITLGDNMMMVAGADGTTMVRAGDELSIDGSTGAVYLGALETTSAEPPAEFDVVLGWADEVRAGHLEVRANADTAADAATARANGAEGIGLCRTEHMFLTEDRLPIMRQMILAATPAKEKMALTRLRLAQRDDFVSLLAAMDGLPVTVRLLDPPLHEFLPDLEELAVAQAKGQLDAAGQELLAAARTWHEQNPMIGTRGVRLGWLKPGLYEMQVTALVEAVAERVAAGGDPQVEVMIPLTVTGPELAGARRWIERALGSAEKRITIGTMIETPRAAQVAGELAEHVDFFSFGTNDLTQLTFGFSRDDVESRLMGLYLDEGLLEANPFEHLDTVGVGALVAAAAQAGRDVKPGLKLGVCGEHGGDPASIAFLLGVGLDYVSCSPYRVPVARLAAAQAVLGLAVRGAASES
jgi:pyruvate, orthophosphate dikinase